MRETPNFTDHHLPSGNCPCCNRTFATTDFRLLDQRPAIDIPQIKAVITDHLVYDIQCSCCHQHKGEFPSTVNAPVQYGIKALCKALDKAFKKGKQLLGLGRCQSNSFDAQIADTTITMIQHILLTPRHRVAHYESMAGLFSNVIEATVRQRLNQRLWGLFIELMQIIVVLYEDFDQQELLEKIFQNEKVNQMVNNILGRESNQLGNAADENENLNHYITEIYKNIS
jgi:hypothetical protein